MDLMDLNRNTAGITGRLDLTDVLTAALCIL